MERMGGRCALLAVYVPCVSRYIQLCASHYGYRHHLCFAFVVVYPGRAVAAQRANSANTRCKDARQPAEFVRGSCESKIVRVCLL